MKGHLDDARRWSGEALALARRLEAQELLVEALWSGARVEHAERHFDAEAKLLQEAISIAAQIGYRALLWQIKHDLALCERERGNAQEADGLIDRARTIVDEIAGSISDDKLRTTFLQSERVQRLKS